MKFQHGGLLNLAIGKINLMAPLEIHACQSRYAFDHCPSLTRKAGHGTLGKTMHCMVLCQKASPYVKYGYVFGLQTASKSVAILPAPSFQRCPKKCPQIFAGFTLIKGIRARFSGTKTRFYCTTAWHRVTSARFYPAASPTALRIKHVGYAKYRRILFYFSIYYFFIQYFF
jgi:hypothetical protein